MTRMKMHSELIHEIQQGSWSPTSIRAIINMTRMGVLPEGWNPGDTLDTPTIISVREEGSTLTRAPQATDGAAPGHSRIPPYLKSNSGFKFGRKSETELEGVLPQLQTLARRALLHSTQDFMVYDGLRTIEEQRSYVKRGVSKTMASKHMRQADGFSHAIDLVPVNAQGQPVWDWNLIYPVVAAVDYAATQMGIASNIRWGGAWDRVLSDFGGDPSQYEKEIRLYAERHPGKDFLDGPHFEWRA